MLQFILGAAAGASLMAALSAVFWHARAKKLARSAKTDDLLEFLYY